MQIGKAGKATTSISTATPDAITVRGQDLVTDLMGHLSFTEYFYLLTTGRKPTEEQTFFLDLLLVSIAEHGLVPTNQAARMTYAADPDFLQGAVAAGLLGCGKVILGTTEIAGQFLRETKTRMDQNGETVDDIIARMRDENLRIPGFGHPLHKPVDPRAQRILALAEERGVAGPYSRLARDIEDAVARIWPKPIPMNVSFAIPAVLLDLDFPVAVLKAIPILARTASLLAHLAEESETPIGFALAHHAEMGITFVPTASTE
ncbi:citryl-CoA lyase [Alphaproteobacteria bacterium GH1-50]|uniref:citrate synthase (unknown stereospecificity) n=1 Tax=Kangsaoukella pontilimi TaxID=2691042 RepID=A0A7C9NCD5_9RHOB|nr:citryl-CoA lyase [Kangsaoukella pontilimi]MXQ06599.1 citryl-CoA lyase [Kangsaoukella pontilimi]